LPLTLNLQFDPIIGGSYNFTLEYSPGVPDPFDPFRNPAGWYNVGPVPEPYAPVSGYMWDWGFRFSAAGSFHPSCFFFTTLAYPFGAAPPYSLTIGYMNWLACGMPPFQSYDPCLGSGPPCPCEYLASFDRQQFSYTCDPLLIVGSGNGGTYYIT
jgi:hypothetical protein